MDVTFFEQSGYYLYCNTTPLPNGKWEASVYFERIADHANTKVPGMRHRLSNVQFDTEDEAMSAACQYGLAQAMAGNVDMG